MISARWILSFFLFLAMIPASQATTAGLFGLDSDDECLEMLAEPAKAVHAIMANAKEYRWRTEMIGKYLEARQQWRTSTSSLKQVMGIEAFDKQAIPLIRELYWIKKGEHDRRAGIGSGGIIGGSPLSRSKVKSKTAEVDEKILALEIEYSDNSLGDAIKVAGQAMFDEWDMDLDLGYHRGFVLELDGEGEHSEVHEPRTLITSEDELLSIYEEETAELEAKRRSFEALLEMFPEKIAAYRVHHHNYNDSYMAANASLLQVAIRNGYTDFLPELARSEAFQQTLSLEEATLLLDDVYSYDTRKYRELAKISVFVAMTPEAFAEYDKSWKRKRRDAWEGFKGIFQ